MPRDLGQFMEVVNDLGRRMSPLAQIAEQAGGLFGMRIPGLSVSSTPKPAPSTAATATGAPATKRAPVKKRAAKKATARKRSA